MRPGAYYHVCNRATEKRVLFQTPADFDLWMRTLRESLEKIPIKNLRFLRYAQPLAPPGQLPQCKTFLQGDAVVGATHAIRLRKRAETLGKGAVYQGRYRCHGVKTNQIFWVVARYIERNPVRAGLTDSPRRWEWSSAGQNNGHSIPLADWPLAKPEKWDEFLDQGGDRVEEARIREALLRGRPFLTLKNHL